MDDSKTTAIALLIGFFGGCCVTGWLFASNHTPDNTFLRLCKEQGYWQTGQTRVICHIDEVKK